MVFLSNKCDVLSLIDWLVAIKPRETELNQKALLLTG